MQRMTYDEIKQLMITDNTMFRAVSIHITYLNMYCLSRLLELSADEQLLLFRKIGDYNDCYSILLNNNMHVLIPDMLYAETIEQKETLLKDQAKFIFDETFRLFKAVNSDV